MSRERRLELGAVLVGLAAIFVAAGLMPFAPVAALLVVFTTAGGVFVAAFLVRKPPLPRLQLDDAEVDTRFWEIAKAATAAPYLPAPQPDVTDGGEPQ